MKKQIALAAFVSILLASCLSTQTTALSAPAETDRGVFNPEALPEEDLCILKIQKYVGVLKVDDTFVGWVSPSKSPAAQGAVIPAGLHVLNVYYNDGERYTKPFPVVGKFEKGKSYLIDATIVSVKVEVDIKDTESGESVKLDTAKLQGNDPSLLSTYIAKILNPTMDEVGHSVVLENEEIRLVFKPDMIFTMTDKANGTEIVGRKGFEMDFSMKSGTNYLLISDVTKMSRQEFLNNSNYRENAEYIFTVVEINDTEIYLDFSKPASMAEKTWKFSYKEIE